MTFCATYGLTSAPPLKCYSSCSAVSPRLRLALHASKPSPSTSLVGPWESGNGQKVRVAWQTTAAVFQARNRLNVAFADSKQRRSQRQWARCNTLRTLSLANMRWQDEDISLFLAGGKEIEGVSDSDKRSGSLGSDGRSDMLACLDSLTLANASLYRPPPLRAVVLTNSLLRDASSSYLSMSLMVANNWYHWM